MRQIDFFEEMIIDNFAGGGEEESGGGGSGCLQCTGTAVGRCGQRRDIQHHSAEKGKMAEKTGGLTAWRL